MKNLKNFKKFGAALTAVAMLATLSTGVFAAEVEEITDVPVIESVEIDVPIIAVDVEDIEDVEEVDLGELLVDDFDLMATGDGNVKTDVVEATESDITITAVTATKEVVDDVTLYNVKLEYTMPVQAAAPQVTLLGYVFTNTVPDTIEDSAIKAVDQKTHVELDGTTVSKGEINFVLSSAQAGISDTATLVLMVGTDGTLTNAGAQAVAIDLSAASTEGEEEGGEDVPTAWEATGATVAPATLNVVATADDAAIKAELAEVVVTVTGADSKSSDNVNVAWALTSGTIAAGNTVTYTGTVTPGTDAEWTGSATVTVTVTIAEASQGGGNEDDDDDTVVRGDVNADGNVMPNDGTLLMRVLAGNATLTPAQEKNADVNADGNVMPNDGTLLMRVLAGNATLD